MPKKTDNPLQPIYDYRESFAKNYSDPVPEPEPAPAEMLRVREDTWTLLGQRIAYPIGVPASPLTANTERIGVLASQGFNVLTYKTVRSIQHDAFPPPNWFFVEGHRRPLPIGDARKEIEVRVSGTDPPAGTPYSMVNSFGMPSADPQTWMPDVERATESLRDDQVLIVSVVGSDDERTGRDLLEDFIWTARLAEQAGAKAIELNLSCPNTLADGEGMGDPICEDPKVTGEIVRAVRAKLGPETKLVAKLGYLVPARLGEVVAEIAEHVDVIAGINTLQVIVRDGEGRYAFRATNDDPDRDRPKAGLSGIAIRDLALDFVQSLVALRRANSRWSFDVIGMGGVMNTHDVRALLASGADAVQATCVTANNIYFARELWEESSLLETALRNERWDFRSAEGLATELNIGLETARELLDSSPDIARKTVMTDEMGRQLYAARDRGPTVREKLERVRWVLAH